MEKEIEQLKKQIEEIKKELEKRPTREEVEQFVVKYVFNNVPLI